MEASITCMGLDVVTRRGEAVEFMLSRGGMGSSIIWVQDHGLTSGGRGGFCQRCRLEDGFYLMFCDRVSHLT